MPTLHWEGRERDLTAHERVSTRLLVEEPALSVGAPSENLLVQGDNLEALKALLPTHAGQVRCIYIDPPTTRARPSSTTRTTSPTRSGWG